MANKIKNNTNLIISELDERKENILLTIIKLYLDTGEPVGSRTISKKLEGSLSSATIRNEMSDLEDMGYIIKPHTSAGRIPSDKGYRFYVNSLMKKNEMEINLIKSEMNARVDKLEDMMKMLIKNISNNTNYATMIKGPTLQKNKIKYVQLSNLEDKKVLAVLVAEGNVVKTAIVDFDRIIDAKQILELSENINNALSGVEIFNLKNEGVNISKKYNKDVSLIINSLVDSIDKEITEKNIYTFGTNNFFKYKELSEKEEVSNLLETFEQKDKLLKLVENVNDEKSNTGINVYIGDETKVDSMKNCSVITANCDFGNGMIGTIGVVGPKRMDYEKVLSTIKKSMEKFGKELADK